MNNYAFTYFKMISLSSKLKLRVQEVYVFEKKIKFFNYQMNNNTLLLKNINNLIIFT